MGAIKDRFLLDRKNSVLVVIDVQEKLCRSMDVKVLEKLTKNITILQEMAGELGIPVLATEQYVKGIGETISSLKERFTEPAIEKMTFSCWKEAPFPERLNSLGRKQVIITGMEAHVCVLQSVIDLLDAGFHIHLVKDAVMSRKKDNWRVGIEAAASAGAIITSTEAAFFQLLRKAGTDEFRKLLKLVK